MRSTPHSRRKTAMLSVMGILFCGLLVAFAVSSKVAAYYPHIDGARPIAATKVRQQPEAVTLDAPTTQAAPAFLLFVFAFAALAVVMLTSAWSQTNADLTLALQPCFRRAHAIRPPPRG